MQFLKEKKTLDDIIANIQMHQSLASEHHLDLLSIVRMSLDPFAKLESFLIEHALAVVDTSILWSLLCLLFEVRYLLMARQPAPSKFKVAQLCGTDLRG